MRCHWATERDQRAEVQGPEEDWEEEPIDPWVLVSEHHAGVLAEVAVAAEEEEKCVAAGKVA